MMIVVEKYQRKEADDMPTMDYSKLLGRSKEFGFNQKELAKEVGISEGQFCKKISGNYAFKQTEIQRICEVLDIDAADIGLYFFTPAVEKHQLSRV